MSNVMPIGKDNATGASRKLVRLVLKDGRIYEGRFIGHYYGDQDRREPYIFRWHFLPKNEPLVDHDRTLNPDQGIYIDHVQIASIEYIQLTES